MAIDYNAKYPSNTDAPDAEYAQGKARDITSASDNTGTPYDKDLVNDEWGFYSALYSEAGITPDGEIEKIGASQKLESLIKVFGKRKNYVADMTSDPYPKDGYIYTLKDYASGNGAGQLKFECKSGTGTDDGGSVINHDTLDFRFEQDFGGIYSANKFGAHPSLSAAANNTALQSWLDYIPDGANGTINEGVYLYTGIVVDHHMTITGAGAPIIAGATTGTVLKKSATSTSTGIDISGGQGVVIRQLAVDGESGNTGDGIVLDKPRGTLINVSVFNQGNDGVRIGRDTTGGNSNLWKLDTIVTASNGRHGVNIHDGDTSFPDVNGGTLVHLDSRSNGGDGLHVNAAWLNTFVNITVQANTGYGIRCTSLSINNRFYGGDQDEGNTAGNILNDGVGNVFVGTSDNGFTDNSTSSLVLNRVKSYMAKLGLGSSKTPSGTALLDAEVGFDGLEEIMRLTNTGNAAADRGFSVDYDLPVSEGAATGVKFIFARAGVTEDSYYAIQVKEDGVALADTVRFDADSTAGNTRFLIYDVDNGTLERVSVGVADSGGSGYKLLRIPN